MKPTEILEIIQEMVPMAKLIFKTHGRIHDRKEAEVNGIRGFLVWDSILYNEITFDDMEGNIISLFTSGSNEKTEAKWNELIDKYGVK